MINESKIKEINEYYDKLILSAKKLEQDLQNLRQAGTEGKEAIIKAYKETRLFTLTELVGMENTIELLGLQKQIKNWRYDEKGNLKD